MLAFDFRRLSERQYSLATDQSFWNFTSAFGGWVAAVAVEALKADVEFRGEVLTQQMQFMAPVTVAEIVVDVELQVRRSRIDFWRVMISDTDGKLMVTADMVAGPRSASDISFNATAPQVKAPEYYSKLEASAMTPKWLACFDQYMVEGRPGKINEQPRSIVLLRARSNQKLNTAILSMICDTPMPRIFFASEQLTFASTLSLSTHIYASKKQISDADDNYIIVETDSAAIRAGISNQQVRLFSMDGVLLATSYQSAVFR